MFRQTLTSLCCCLRWKRKVDSVNRRRLVFCHAWGCSSTYDKTSSGYELMCFLLNKTNYNWGVSLYGLYIRTATPLAFFAMHSVKLSYWRLPATVFDALYPLKMKPLPGYWDADHDRPRTRNTRPSNVHCTHIFSCKSPTLSLRTSILLLASVILAPNRNYTRRKRQWCHYVNV